MSRTENTSSQLSQWSVQIKLVPVDAPYFNGANIANNDIKSVTVVRMEAPCRRGIELAVKNALHASGKLIPWRIVVVSTDGNIIE